MSAHYTIYQYADHTKVKSNVVEYTDEPTAVGSYKTPNKAADAVRATGHSADVWNHKTPHETKPL